MRAAGLQQEPPWAPAGGADTHFHTHMLPEGSSSSVISMSEINRIEVYLQICRGCWGGEGGGLDLINLLPDTDPAAADNRTNSQEIT